MSKALFSLVLPAHNEARNLESCVKGVQRVLKDYDYEIIIAEDGSSDGTDRIAERLAKQDKRIRFLHEKEKLGRGLALKNAFRVAKGENIGYMDVDMATDIRYLKELVELSKDYDVVTGSRYLKDSKTERPALRDNISRIYNFMIRFFLGCKVYDSQCGFKAFSRKFVEREIFKIMEKTWAWDTAVLVIGMKKKYRVMEFPVEWKEKKEDKHSSSFGRICNDVKKMGPVLIKLFLKYRLGLNIDI